MNLAAQRLDNLNGKRVYRVPVRIRHNDSRAMCTIAERVELVIAHSAREAADYIRKENDTIAETEITAYGPQGGETRRFIGWYSAIGNGIAALRRLDARQNGLPFDWGTK